MARARNDTPQGAGPARGPGGNGRVGARAGEETFRNLSMTGPEEGTVKYVLNATYRLREKTTLAAESFVQDDRLNYSTQFVSSVGVKQAFSRGTMEAGYKYLSEDRSGAGQGGATSQIAYAGVAGNITKKLTGALKREKVLTSGEVTDYPTKTTAERNYPP